MFDIMFFIIILHAANNIKVYFKSFVPLFPIAVILTICFPYVQGSLGVRTWLVLINDIFEITTYFPDIIL